MNPRYIIIECGCEGIDHLLYATDSSDDVIKKINNIKSDILTAHEYKKNILDKYKKSDSTLDLDDDDLCDVWDKMYADGELNKNYYKNSKKNPDSYCVQKFDGERFDCACDELKCNPTQSWIM